MKLPFISNLRLVVAVAALHSNPAIAQMNLPTSQPVPECFPGEATAKEVNISTLSQAQVNCADYKDHLKQSSRGTASAPLKFFIRFDNGSDIVSADFAEQLSKVVNMMNQPHRSKSRMEVEGHANATGSAALNQRLTERRADRVVQIMVQRYGIAPGRLTSRGYGFDKPLAGSDPADGSNRRVQFLSLDPKPQN